MTGKMKLLAACALLMFAAGCGGCKDGEVCDQPRTVTNSDCQFIAKFPAGWSSEMVQSDKTAHPDVSDYISAYSGDGAVHMLLFCNDGIRYVEALALESYVALNARAIIPEGITPEPTAFFTTTAGQEAGSFEYYDPSESMLAYYAFIKYPSTETFPLEYLEIWVDAQPDTWPDWKDTVLEIIMGIGLY